MGPVSIISAAQAAVVLSGLAGCVSTPPDTMTRQDTAALLRDMAPSRDDIFHPAPGDLPPLTVE